MKKVEMDSYEIEIPEQVIAGRLGFLGEKEIPDDFKDIYTQYLEIAKNNSRITALYDDFPIEMDDNIIRVMDEIFESDLVSKHLRGSQSVTALLVTLGKEIDNKIESLHEEGEELRSFFLDGISSELVEFASRKLDSQLRKEHLGFKGSARISPGYGDFPIEINRRIIEELNGNDMGVHWKEGSYQMIPRKTVSAFIGWVKD